VSDRWTERFDDSARCGSAGLRLIDLPLRLGLNRRRNATLASAARLGAAWVAPPLRRTRGRGRDRRAGSWGRHSVPVSWGGRLSVPRPLVGHDLCSRSRRRGWEDARGRMRGPLWSRCRRHLLRIARRRFLGSRLFLEYAWRSTNCCADAARRPRGLRKKTSTDAPGPSGTRERLPHDEPSRSGTADQMLERGERERERQPRGESAGECGDLVDSLERGHDRFDRRQPRPILGAAFSGGLARDR
jgi:hypothetical protein